MLLGAMFSASCMKMQDTNEETGSLGAGMSKLTLALDKISLGKAMVLADSSKVISKSLGPEPSIESELDTNKYWLSISGSSEVVYSGRYVARPQAMYLKPGTYKVSLTSREFKEPERTPLFGDEKSVKCKKDSSQQINLLSKQLTGGIRFNFTDKFKSYFSGPGVYIKKDTALTFVDYSDGRYFFYYAGKISLVYKAKERDTVFYNRSMKAEELVTLTLDYDLAKMDKGGINVSFDTTRTRVSEYFNVGGDTPAGCCSVLEAQGAVGDTVTVFGYIVGGDASKTKFKTEAPFSSQTHIVIAGKPSQTLWEEAMAVELSSGSSEREELNLVDNPNLLGHSVIVRGVVTPYFDHPGLKKVTSYSLP